MKHSLILFSVLFLVSCKKTNVSNQVQSQSKIDSTAQYLVIYDGNKKDSFPIVKNYIPDYWSKTPYNYKFEFKNSITNSNNLDANQKNNSIVPLLTIVFDPSKDSLIGIGKKSILTSIIDNNLTPYVTYDVNNQFVNLGSIGFRINDYNNYYSLTSNSPFNKEYGFYDTWLENNEITNNPTTYFNNITSISSKYFQKQHFENGILIPDIYYYFIEGEFTCKIKRYQDNTTLSNKIVKGKYRIQLKYYK